MTFPCFSSIWADRKYQDLTLTPNDIELVSGHLKARGPLRLEAYVECIDHTVSRETFTLFHERERDLLITFPRPPENKLSDYYESEDYISHTDAKRNLIERIYHVAKEYSLKRKLKLIDRFSPQGKRLLDIGAGTGDFLKTCQDAGWDVTGIEPSDKARRLSESKVGSDKCHDSLERFMKTNSGEFDVITLWHVLEHVPDLYEFIARIKSLLSKNGCLVVAVPNFKCADAEFYGKHWAAYDVPRHLWHFSRNSIERIFSDFEMEVAEEAPLYFDSFYVSLLSEKYRHGRPRYLAGFYQGLKSNIRARASGEYSSLIYVLK